MKLSAAGAKLRPIQILQQVCLCDKIVYMDNIG